MSTLPVYAVQCYDRFFHADVCVGVHICSFAGLSIQLCTDVWVGLRKQISKCELKDDGLQNLGLVSLGVTKGAQGKLQVVVCLLL